MSDTTKGILAMICACTIWGLSPIYYKILKDVPPLEVLSHRTLWSFVFFGILLSLQGHMGDLKRAFSNRRSFFMIAAAGIVISLNWFGFILSVQIGIAVQASLGYYIFPLVAVALGFLVFGERLSRLQVVSVLLATAGVAVLTVGMGELPTVALFLATTFGLYGLIKKSLDVAPMVSVTGEVALLLPLALVWLAGVHFGGWSGVSGRQGAFFGKDVFHTAMLIFSGVITAGPLMLFSYATRRLALSTVGLIQYLNPSLQFLVAVLLFHETFTIWYAACFGLIWLALVIYSVAGFGAEKSRARAASNSSTERTILR